MAKSHYDYIIVGNGLAGLKLALAFSKDSYFNSKSFALIDQSNKSINDKTWSYWDNNSTENSLIFKSWRKANIYTYNTKTQLKLEPYNYNTIKSLDFYKYAISELKSKQNFHFIIDDIISISEANTVEVSSKTALYTASHVFDSRLTDEMKIELNNAISITQHFKGWIIKTKTDVFDEQTVTIMDYRLKDKNKTTFNYVLPFSKNEALVEFTYFNDTVVNETVYDHFLKTYIQDYLNISEFEIIETEVGQIPMTNLKFEQFNTTKITKIGTAGGWVKASTGYSFKLTDKKVKGIIKNIKSNQLPSKGLYNKKYKFYDKVFLKVLKDENYKGEWIFHRFYTKNSIQTMFRFLDEESTFIEELKIMLSLFSWSFIKAFFKTL
jgi:lycopene beta-cyclase